VGLVSSRKFPQKKRYSETSYSRISGMLEAEAHEKKGTIANIMEK
jgi:hypothetical protein